MGAAEHLKALCCLGLPPEAAMVAVVPLLHEIIPHDGARLALVAPDAKITTGYSENPASGALFRERLWQFMDDPSSLMSLWVPGVRAVAIGWAVHRQGGDYLESGYYREIEAPLDSCWLLDAMIGDGGRTIGFVCLTRPRCTRPFTVDDVQRLDGLRPWLAHAFRRSNSPNAHQEDEAPTATAGATVLSAQVVLTSDGTIVYETSGVEVLLRILTGELSNYTRYVPVSDRLPAPQTKVGIHLALGKTKPVIADELGIQLSSVADLTKRLYQTLDVHNSAELATKIWLDQRQVEARQNLRRAG
jgi:hypothetical protein